MYACDPQWWDVHASEVLANFPGEKWTQDGPTAKKHGLNHIPGAHNAGLSLRKELIHFNANSGAQAVNLAVLWGARRLILVGFDMKLAGKTRHWFGDHPGALNKPTDYPDLIAKFKRIADDLKSLGVEVWNTSMESALPWFPKKPLDELLSSLSATSPSIDGTPLSRDSATTDSASSSDAGASRNPATFC